MVYCKKAIVEEGIEYEEMRKKEYPIQALGLFFAEGSGASGAWLRRPQQ
jgi:hypothetical protein